MASLLGGLLHLPEHEFDKLVERVLTNDRVEYIARRITEMLLEEMRAGLQERDKKRR